MNLKELADLLGLSQTTVSRALNDYPEVSETTRARVREAAERYNYRPNNRARSLATGRAMTIGHVIPVSTQHEMVNPIFADFIAGAGEVYSELGYDMSLSVVPDNAEADAYREMAAKGSVDGVIVHGPRTQDERIDLLRQLGLPFVVHGRAGQETESYNWVDINNQRAFQRATRFLLDLGHQRIALLNGLENMDFAVRRRRGHLAELKDRGVTIDFNLIFSAEMTESYGYRTALKLLNAPNPPTAFLVSSMITAIGVRRAAHKMGLELGHDISVIIHDDVLSYMQNGDDVPIFTATRSSVRTAGRLCARMLLDIIEGPGQPPRHELLEAELMLGESTGQAPGRA